MRSILFFYIILSVAELNAQSPDINLQKYWRYRESLKNFVVPGNCFGCSLPAEKRTGDDIIEWSDATIHLGYYIGMLATEHKLLTLYNQPLQRIHETERELFYALEAVNRLDRWAEFRWEEYALGINHTGQTPPYSHLNGFFIRDDIPFATDFFSQTINNKTVRENLNSSFFSLPGGYHLKTSISGYTVGINEGYGPREESLDQVTQLYAGLALVRKLIDPSIKYTDITGIKYFMDQESSFVQEVKNISHRITSQIQSHDWKIENPVMPDCVQGVCGSRSCAIGACGGGNVTGVCFGFYRADCYIQQQGVWCNSDAQTDGNSFVWSGAFQYNSLGAEDFKILTLATIGHVWGANTNQVVRNRCSQVQADHLPLLYAALYDDATVMLPQNLYIEMFDKAWCSGSNGYEGPVEWRGVSWLLYGPNEDEATAPVHFSNIDYMLYFNLYALIYPQYLSNGYQYFKPDEICDEAFTDQNVLQEEQRNIFSYSSISLSRYCVQSSSGEKSNLNMVAGNSILLEEGTVFMPGTEVTAIINPALGKYLCYNKTPESITPVARVQNVMEVYPNPSYGNFNVVLPFLPAEAKLIIYNSLGQEIQTRNLISELNTISLKTPGIYFISIKSKQFNESQKAIVSGYSY